MKDKQAVLDSILNQGMLPLFFYENIEVSLQVVRTLYKAGVRVMEYTNRAEEAFENFKVLKEKYKCCTTYIVYLNFFA